MMFPPNNNNISRILHSHRNYLSPKSLKIERMTKMKKMKKTKK